MTRSSSSHSAAEGRVPVRIARVAVAHPPYRVTQHEAARAIAMHASDPRRVAALARGTHIDERALAIPPGDLVSLGAAGARNDIYRALAPALAMQAVRGVLGEGDASDLGCLVTSSCTGYTVPSWGVGIAEAFALPRSATRLPITEAGCAGGAVAIARAVDQLRAREGAGGLAASVELCSLAFHPGGGDGNLTSTLIFGDGAGAALLRTDDGPGLTVIDSVSALIPDSQDALGFDLTDRGFYPVVSRELATLIPAPTEAAIAVLLERNGLAGDEVGAWLLHPGGPRILTALERGLGLAPHETRWSWDSMRAYGNTSSAAIFDVLRRYFHERTAGEYAVVAAFGPGISIELLLLRAC